jgi:hypothetical protein
MSEYATITYFTPGSATICSLNWADVIKDDASALKAAKEAQTDKWSSGVTKVIVQLDSKGAVVQAWGAYN